MRLRRYLGEGLTFAMTFAVLGLLATAVIQVVVPVALHFKARGIADNLAQAMYLARAQAVGFGLPVSIRLPDVPVECDGSRLTVHIAAGNLTAFATVNLRVPLPEFRAEGGKLTFYPDGRVEVGS